MEKRTLAPIEKSNRRFAIVLLSFAGSVVVFFLALIVYAIWINPPTAEEQARWAEEDRAQQLDWALRRNIESGTDRFIVSRQLWRTNPKFNRAEIEDNEIDSEIFRMSLDTKPASFDDFSQTESDFYAGKPVKKIQNNIYETPVSARVTILWVSGIAARHTVLIDGDLTVRFRKERGKAEILSVR